MTHDDDVDIEVTDVTMADLFNYILKLEERIINLEKEISNKVMPIIPDDSYYWEHG